MDFLVLLPDPRASLGDGAAESHAGAPARVVFQLGDPGWRFSVTVLMSD